MAMITIHLPYNNPPLRSNMRKHWAVKASITRDIRRAAATAVRAAKLTPIEGPVVARFVWSYTGSRKPDPDGSAPTMKAALDGIVDAGLLPDDNHQIVREVRYAIEIGDVAGCRIEIRPHHPVCGRAEEDE